MLVLGASRAKGGLLVGCTLLVLVAPAPSPLPAQSVSGLQLTVGTHALTVPWHLGPVETGFDPAIMVGGDRPVRAGEHWTLTLGVNLGFFQDHWWMTGLSLEPELRIGRTLPGGVYADAGLGLGYMHYFWRRKTLAFRDGRYVEERSLGNPSLIVPLSLTLGFRGKKERPPTVSPILSARWGAQVLFRDEVPVMTHLSLSGGVRIQRGRRPGGG